MSKLRVLVVGASIAGPTTAYWFAKAGATVTVIERFPKLREGGQNVDIRTCGVTTMRKMSGMEAAVRAKIVPIGGLRLVESDGRPIGTLTATGDPDQQSLLSEYEIFRGDLSRILYDMTKDNENIKYIFGEQVAFIQQNEKEDGQVMVEFQNGLSKTSYDLVVACDGATSRTRAIGLGCGQREYVTSIRSWAAYFSTSKDLLNGSKIATAHSSIPGRFMAIGPDLKDLNEAAMFKIYPRSAEDSIMTPFREALKQGDEATKKFVAQNFGDHGWRTEEVLKEMWNAKDFYASENVQVKTPTLSRGRFVMVGDAGYASGPTGVGTSLALTGGYVLAGEILKHGGDLTAGLRGYETTMRPILNELTKIPPGVPGLMAPQTAWRLWLRNTIFAWITWSGVINFVQKWFGGAFGNSKEYKLPEYDWIA
jgi:2-polyprenyl-6-methoxyphenol hydroxylase-like FAD-dependent oxidoreductase